jgi:hypothetical protein
MTAGAVADTTTSTSSSSRSRATSYASPFACLVSSTSRDGDANALDAMAIAEVATRAASIAYREIFPPHLAPPDHVQRWTVMREGLAVPRTWTGVLTANTRAQRYHERLGWGRDGAVNGAVPGVTEERWRLKDGSRRG